MVTRNDKFKYMVHSSEDYQHREQAIALIIIASHGEADFRQGRIYSGDHVDSYLENIKPETLD